ncbi:MAG TPA: methyltransferase domain-containing protein [Myxococcales bacterium]|nr:methyltransferase domain-containing protein [Myxococcales bacterium]
MSRPPGGWIFELLARPYEILVFQRAWREHARRMLDRLPPREGRPRLVLDAGCGPGVSALAMLVGAPDDRFVGLDVSRQMLARAAARRRAEGVAPERLPLLRGDVTRLPLAAACCDGVTGHSFLYLVSDQQRALTEIRRVLRPGGRLVLLEPAAGPRLLPVLRSLRHGARFAASMACWRVVSGRIGQFTAERLHETVAAAGFARVSVEPTLDGLGLLAVAES